MNSSKEPVQTPTNAFSQPAPLPAEAAEPGKADRCVFELHDFSNWLRGGILVIMKIDQIAPEALRLPAKERAILAASLWESIEDPYDLAAERTDAEAIKLAIERDEEIESGTVVPISHEELMRRLRA